MLTPLSQRRSLYMRSRQKGVVLLITLIMLVAMTLAAIALMRSVDTSNMVAGNMAFQQSTYNVADVGTEQAITFLLTMVANPACDSIGGFGAPCPAGYKSYNDPLLEPSKSAPTKTWDAYWKSMLSSPGVHALSGLPSGYTGAFMVESLCSANQQVSCTLASSSSSSTSTEGGNQGKNNVKLDPNTQTIYVHYYRITTRVEGPRNSVGFVQTMIAM